VTCVNLAGALSGVRGLLAQSPASALKEANAILRVISEEPTALALAGRALGAIGRGEQAIVNLRRSVTLDPNIAEHWRWLADQYNLIGDSRLAGEAVAQELRASVNDPRLMATAEALCKGELPLAERLVREHLRERPTDIAAIRMMAELGARVGRYREAQALLERALVLAPSFSGARFNLATILYRSYQPQDALRHLALLLREEPGNVSYITLKAAALIRLGDLHEAIEEYRASLRVAPSASRIWMSLGHALKTVGGQAESVSAYRQSLALEPTLGEAWWSLANLKTVRLTASDIAQMEAALGAATLGEEDRFHLYFALGKAHEDAGAFDEAFDSYVTANRLRRAALHYDPEQLQARIARVRALFTPQFIAERAQHGCLNSEAIFVVGMPRSGSTLIEQILASHPEVEGTQELPDIQQMVNRLVRDRGVRYPDVLAQLGPAELRALGEEYIERTRVQRKTGRPFFIDKMPNNWLHVGFIRLILPNAKIIDTRRHPMACCWSNFKQHFARGQDFSYSFEDLGRYYNDYAGLMAHWHTLLPGHVHTAPYERIVLDTEVEIRALLSFLGLQFDPACLRFYDNRRAVRTASSEQVRRPINHSGLDQWRVFESRLGLLREALGTERGGPQEYCGTAIDPARAPCQAGM
jgi:tetratricopeptide (TPR) repeat protein